MLRKIRIFAVVILMSTILLVACASEQPARQDNEKITQFNKLDDAVAAEPSDEAPEQTITGLYAPARTGVTLYFLDETAGQLSPETRKISGNETNEELAHFIMKELVEGPESSVLSPVISDDVKINRVDISEDILAVDLSSEFNDTEELALARAALVNSLLDMEAFKYIKIFIDGREATVTPDIQSGPIGLLTRYPMGAVEITALEEQTFKNQAMRKVNWELFFRDNSGEYLLSQVRQITITEGKAAESIVNELIKGPAVEGEGYYATLPKGVTLQKTAFINGQDDNNGVALYFSKEFLTEFPKSDAFEESMIGSLIYSLTSLPHVSFVKVYYDDGHGLYIDEPIHNIPFNRRLTMKDYPNKAGKRMRVYFGSDQNLLLVPEYRAVADEEEDIAARILKELTTDPVTPGSIRVLPPHITAGDIKLGVKGELAAVDIPVDYFDEMVVDNKRIIRDIYALVNSLTDPINGTGIKEVQFTVEGKVIDSYMDIALKDSFVFNPALISEK